MKSVRKALTIAGSDSGGGAGIQADLKTFAALGVYGTSALTAITAQNTVGVTQVYELSPKLVGAQIDAIMEDIGAHAVKTGMLANVAIIACRCKKDSPASAKEPRRRSGDGGNVRRSSDQEECGGGAALRAYSAGHGGHAEYSRSRRTHGYEDPWRRRHRKGRAENDRDGRKGRRHQRRSPQRPGGRFIFQWQKRSRAHRAAHSHQEYARHGLHVFRGHRGLSRAGRRSGKRRSGGKEVHHRGASAPASPSAPGMARCITSTDSGEIEDRE